MVNSGGHYAGFRGDTVYVIWQESRDNPFGTWILFARSNDGGKTFGPNVIAAGGVNPSMRVDSAGIIYLAYQNNADIFFRKSIDGGMTFTSRVKVNDDTISQIGQEMPAIAVNNRGQIFVAWRDQRTAPGQPHQAIFSAASYDGGNGFTSNAQVNVADSSYVGGIDIGADDSGKVYVVYGGVLNDRAGAVVARSIDSGQSFSFHTLASDTPGSIASPSMAVTPGGVVGIAWPDGPLRFSISFDNGQSFSSSVRIDYDSNLTYGTQPVWPSLAYRNGNFYISWEGRKPDFPDKIFFSYTLDNGQSFAPNVDVNANTTDPNTWFRFLPSLSVNEMGNAFVAWLDGRYIGPVNDTWLTFGAPGKFVHLFKGDLNLDEMLTPTDVVLELNAVFSGQSFPAPFRNADGNCSGDLSPADVVELLRVVFLNWPVSC